VRLVRILLPIDLNGTTEACARIGFGLAERFGAELEVLIPCPPPAQRLPYATELSPVYFTELMDVGAKQAELEKRQGKHWLQAMAPRFPKVKAELFTMEDLAGPAVAMRAKVSDLTVLPNIAAKEERLWGAARDAALFHSGRPVLIVPDEAGGHIGETVVIAWKDAIEAVRAVAAATPFLTTAKRIRLVSIMEDGKDSIAPAMADYLRKAGLLVQAETLAQDSREVGEILLDAAGSGVLLVMGAYGHWRWREWVFGGATFYVLRNTDVPVLMVH
jgi:nucleotide-binding universal stress UspA family protein